MGKNKEAEKKTLGEKRVVLGPMKSKHHYTKKEVASYKRKQRAIEKDREQANQDYRLTGVSLDGLDVPKYIKGEAKKIYQQVIEYYRKLGMEFLSSLDLNSLDMYSNEVANYRYSKSRIPEIEDNLDKLFDDAEGDMEPKERWKSSLDCAKTLAALRKDCSDREKLILQLEEHLSLDPKGRKDMQERSKKKKEADEDPFFQFMSKNGEEKKA